MFSTKNRALFLQDQDLRGRLYAYLAGGLQRCQCEPILINGTPDHLHVLFYLNRTHSIAQLVAEIKSSSAKWLKNQGAVYHEFAWQSGYGVFSVSQSQVGAVHDYVADQEEHHRSRSFQDEFRLLCEKHGLAIDERYAWQ